MDKLAETELAMSATAKWLRNYNELADHEIEEVADALDCGYLMMMCRASDCGAPNSVHNDSCWNCIGEL